MEMLERKEEIHILATPSHGRGVGRFGPDAWTGFEEAAYDFVSTSPSLPLLDHENACEDGINVSHPLQNRHMLISGALRAISGLK